MLVPAADMQLPQHETWLRLDLAQVLPPSGAVAACVSQRLAC